jgi:hypothetical protein
MENNSLKVQLVRRRIAWGLRGTTVSYRCSYDAHYRTTDICRRPKHLSHPALYFHAVARYPGAWQRPRSSLARSCLTVSEGLVGSSTLHPSYQSLKRSDVPTNISETCRMWPKGQKGHRTGTGRSTRIGHHALAVFNCLTMRNVATSGAPRASNAIAKGPRSWLLLRQAQFPRQHR